MAQRDYGRDGQRWRDRDQDFGGFGPQRFWGSHQEDYDDDEFRQRQRSGFSQGQGQQGQGYGSESGGQYGQQGQGHGYSGQGYGQGGYGGQQQGGSGAGYGQSYGQTGYGAGQTYGQGGFQQSFGQGGRAGGYGQSSGQLGQSHGPAGQMGYGQSNQYGQGQQHFGQYQQPGGSQSGYGQSSYGQQRQGMYRGVGPKGYTRSDDRIREDVNDVLTDDGSIDASEIEVQVANGEVTLSGTVDERETRRRAEDLVESCSGVRHVQNNIRVKSGEGLLSKMGLGSDNDQGQSSTGKSRSKPS